MRAEACACTSGFIALFHCLATNSFLYCHPPFVHGEAPAFLLEGSLVALNGGSQPINYSTMVLSFENLSLPHPRSSAWGPDETSLPCPALVTYIVVYKCMWPLMCS